MRRRELLLGAAGAATAAVVMSTPVSAAILGQDDVRARFAQVVRDGQRADDALNPLGLARRGERPIGDLFVDPLSDAYAAKLEQNKRGELRALAAIDRAALPPGDQIAYDVFRYQAEKALEDIDSGVFAIRRMAPLNASFGLHVEFPDYMSSASGFDTVQDYEDRLVQLDGFTGFMTATVARLRQGMAAGYHQPRIVVRNVLGQVEAFLSLPVDQSPLYSPVTRFPDAIGAADRTRLEAAYRQAVEQRAYPAYALWRDFLRDEYLPHATEGAGLWAMKDGARVYASDLVRHTTTTMAAEEIHRVGLKEVASIREEMEGARRAAGFQGDLSAFFEHVRTEPSFYYTKPADLIAHFERIEAKVWQKMPELFSRRPKAAFEVRPLPALGDQRGTGYYRPGPPDASQPGVLYFNMAMLNTRPIPTLETLALHEGVPGHHYQISLVQEDASLPDLLRFRLAPATAYSEGWGLYAESLGKDLGLFTDPYQWFGHLDMEMLRAVRLVVDTGLHALRWDRQQAIDYMLANTSMAERDVAVEIDRYITNAGQACAYKIGELKIQELRQRSEQAQGTAFDIRRFHDQILDTGALPLDVLEAKIDRWLSEA
ncbi:uncharacterized protein (DUF885 family) [Brevundimonas nasdae]|uniref:DUF885 domain-containing protein n=1 Tax=Brevundimonas nasdae TaxID=172043 RepID=UPI001912B34D|nr:DUF885 domain-containing protein [Brevundimonas nasdae]MBK6026849.1 DUF885 domain-containing protein [Brevundimonas nasdae]MDQ0453530.1 uncharacterized protein (DUF885 family) [Brevundimonas nasdae]